MKITDEGVSFKVGPNDGGPPWVHVDGQDVFLPDVSMDDHDTSRAILNHEEACELRDSLIIACKKLGLPDYKEGS